MTWSIEQAISFWEKRNTYLVYKYVDQDDQITKYKNDLQIRETR